MATIPAPMSDQPSDDDLLRAVAAAMSSASSDLSTVAAGRLVSLSLTVSADRFGEVAAPGAECQWLSPGLSLHASGEAIRFDKNLGQCFRELRADWTLLGGEGGNPICFFTAPPPNSPDRPALWVPKVAIHQRGSAITVICSMRRDRMPAASMVEDWLALLQSMLTPVARKNGVGGVLTTSTSPEAEQWSARVRATTQAITDRRFDKVVLSRRFAIAMASPPAITTLVHRLAAINPQCYTFALPHGRGSVVASTPEILASKRGDQVVAHALAGTTKRHASEAESQAAATRLLITAKERHEHEVVVAAISDQLRSLCRTVQVPSEPMIMALRFVQHLWTPISGRIRPGVGLLDIVECLHPTPAVLGTPREAAARWLDQMGERRDGLYSGIAGWIDTEGDGDAAVVLRSAFIEDRSVVLWAGAGIMADSVPEAELAETELKLATMLEVLQTT